MPRVAQWLNTDALLNAWQSDSRTSHTRTFLIVLLAGDLVFVILHFLPVFGMLNDPQFSLETDGGHPERYQYLKTFTIMVLLLLLMIKTRVGGFGLWALVFLYLLLDDSLSLHESLGELVANGMAFSPAIGLRAQDFGELAVSVGVGLIFLLPVAVFYWRGTQAFKDVSKYLVALLAALAFFGILIDMVHVAVNMGWKVAFVLGTIEDGGEMVVMSITTAFVFFLRYRNGTLGEAA